MTVFDATDINELVTRYDAVKLRKEIRQAERKADFCNEDEEWPVKSYWLEYAKACLLAIDIQNWLESDPVTRSINDPASTRPIRETIESIKARHDIVDFIEQYIPLRKSGGRFTGLCPFHQDKKSPSFVVYPKDQSYHCFGCQKHGDILTFLCDYEHLTIRESIDKLARSF
jgi:hypothetical protein